MLVIWENCARGLTYYYMARLCDRLAWIHLNFGLAARFYFSLKKYSWYFIV